MTTISRSALVEYDQDRMYALVADIESYPVFLPWCRDARILERDDETITAMIEIAYKGIHKSFTTRNRVHPCKMMEMHLVEGPFKYLRGYWHFAPLEGHGCKVTLDLEFEFSNKLIGMTVGRVFNEIANQMVDSFCARAQDVYG